MFWEGVSILVFIHVMGFVIPPYGDLLRWFYSYLWEKIQLWTWELIPWLFITAGIACACYFIYFVSYIIASVMIFIVKILGLMPYLQREAPKGYTF